MPSNDERLLAAAIYLISFVTAFIGPLVIWLLKKDESYFVDYHGKEYLNFFISCAVYGLIFGVLTLVIVGIFLLWILSIFVLVFTIVGAVKAFSGEEYRIPLIFRLIR